MLNSIWYNEEISDEGSTEKKNKNFLYNIF